MSAFPSEIACQNLPTAQFARLEATLRAAMAAGIFPAASLALYRRGELAFSGAWGWLDPASRQRPAGVDTLFDLASLTKLFTSTAALLLMDDGRWQLDTPLADVLPDFAAERWRPIVGQQDPHTLAPLPATEELLGKMVDARTVTLRQILAHTAGLPGWRALFMEENAPQPQVDVHERRWRRLLPFAQRYPFNALPGAAVNYSDIGMILLGAALARANGRSLPALFRERILTPLGLRSIGFLPLAHGRQRENIAPTERDDRWRGRRCHGEVHDENAAALGGVAGHAGLFGTAADIARFGEAWRANELGMDAELWQAATQVQAGDVKQERRGLGWQRKSAQDSAGARFSDDSYGHTGFTGGSLWVDPQRQMVVALLTNRVYRGRHAPGIEDIRRRVHDILADPAE